MSPCAAHVLVGVLVGAALVVAVVFLAAERRRAAREREELRQHVERIFPQ